MLASQIQRDELLALNKLTDLASYADRLVTAEALRREFDSGVVRRKSFCEALGIGESTLSTWLQTGRIPRLAAVAYALWLAHKDLKSEIQRHDELASDPYVIQCRDGYAVVRPADRATPDAVGHVIASGIETAELARKTATAHSQRFRNVLDRAITVLREREDEEPDQEDNRAAEIAFDLEHARDLRLGPYSIGDILRM